MPKCYYCGAKGEYLPFRCKYCGMLFCKSHRIPENHDCPFDLRQNSKKPYLLYQDALDFMSKGVTVVKIYEYVEAKKLNKREATKLLNSFIENSDDIEIRINSILAFKLLVLKSDKAYEILENCLISDENPSIRSTAAKILLYNFPKKSKAAIKWALENDKELNIEENLKNSSN